jgi:hypothetical protein
VGGKFAVENNFKKHNLRGPEDAADWKSEKRLQ